MKQLHLISLTKKITCVYQIFTKLNFFVFYFVSLEVGTAASKMFCVMIPSLVDTSLDFGLFRVVGGGRVSPPRGPPWATS